MSEQTNNVDIAVLKRDLEHLSAEVTSAKAQIKVLQDDKEKAFKWGIMALGAAVLAMGSWIFNLLTTGRVS